MEVDKKESSASWAPELVKLASTLLWVFLALYTVILFKDPLLTILNRGEVTKLSIASIQIEFARSELAKIDGRSGIPKTIEEFEPFKERIQRSALKLSGANLLWVDDQHPTQNLRERRALMALGVHVDIVRSSEEALKLLRNNTGYDLLISDMDRPADAQASCTIATPPSAGCALLQALHGLGEKQTAPLPPTIIYAGNYDPGLGTPPYALGMTNRVDQFLQLVLDGLERRKAVAEPYQLTRR